ncbi:MAG: ribose 5-phosphate isomerase B [Desulfobacterota bacterium]|nr:ribose 5-phosphate isomerase B [Thermodesulfobacteriota bacterium]
MPEKISIGSDHRGFKLKNMLVHYLQQQGVTVDDVGVFSEEAVDYPGIAGIVAHKVSCRECDRGILICGSGIGMSITANKFPDVRAALCHDEHSAVMSRKHNDANVLVLSESIDPDRARRILELWRTTPFEGGRHQRRLDLIRAIEQENFKKDILPEP